MTAEKLIERIKARGGRVFPMPSRMVFCLTTDEELRDGLIKLGGRYYSPPNFNLGGLSGYRRGREPGDKLEWDIWIHQIEVTGKTTVYEAAGGKLPPLPDEPDEPVLRAVPDGPDGARP